MNNFLAPHSVVLFSLFFTYNFTKSPRYVADNLFIDLVEWRTVILLLLLMTFSSSSLCWTGQRLVLLLF